MWPETDNGTQIRCHGTEGKEGQSRRRSSWYFICTQAMMRRLEATGTTKQWRRGDPGGAQEGCTHAEQRPDSLPGRAGKGRSH